MKKKTVIIIILGLVLIAAVIGSLFLKNLAGVWPWQFPSMGSYSDKEIEEKALTFTRNYPDLIKGNWEPSPFHMKYVIDDAEEIKQLGVNTVSITAEYILNQDGSYKIEYEKWTKTNLAKAKEKGFAVFVATNFVAPEGFRFKEQGIDITLEEYLQMSEETTLEWAEFAELLSAEYFAPQNEFDIVIRENFAETEEEVARITSDWHAEMLPKIRQVYSGQIIAKLANTREGDNLKGYDYVGLTISHEDKPLDQFRQELVEKYKIISKVAENSNCKWLVSEAWFPWGGLYYPKTTNKEGESLDGLQADYFIASIEEYKNVAGQKPLGYIFIAWAIPGEEIQDRPAEQVIREFFQE